ncbi:MULTISPECIES: hypothetical protein, partial [unclassified Bartonella]|uniref:hypothetical protein n=1 Tax=unclassified Bartonella TaxID=2645622 RepID=UPI0035CFDBFC
WSNSTKKFQDFIYRYGNDNAIVSAHSRGTITVSNGANDLQEHGIHSVAKKTDFYLVGAAAHMQSMANTVDYLSDGEKNYIYTQGHMLDPISTVIGYNWPTAYKAPLNLDFSLLEKGIKNPFYMTIFAANSLFTIATNPIREMGRAVLGFNPSTHNCYGEASSKCQTNYGSFGFKKLYSTRTGNKK